MNGAAWSIVHVGVRRRRVAGVVVLVAFLFAVATVRLFLRPSTDAVRPVDAVVLFAGGRGERLILADHLMGNGVAPNLVIPNGMAPEWPAGNRACTETRHYHVYCPRPDPDTTQGEARAIAELAERERWRTVLVVTSTYHVARAGLLLDRCFDGEVLTVAATPRMGTLAWASRLRHEWFAWTRAVVLNRGC